VLIVPNLESGNMLAKSLCILAQADMAGIVLGAKVPIVLAGRNDTMEVRMAACVLASLVAASQSQRAPAPAALAGVPVAA
jgi:phosphotransacetylase